MSAFATKTWTRRRWLGASLAFGAVAAAGGAVALVRTGDYVVDPVEASRLVVFAPWQFVVMTELANRIVAPDHPEDDSIPTPEEVSVASYIDGYLAGMRPSMRRDLLRMIQYVEHLAPLAVGYGHRFTSLLPEERDEVLRGIESSRFDLLRAGFDGLKSLVMMGYYRDPRTFRLLGYDGPFVGRPAAGFP